MSIKSHKNSVKDKRRIALEAFHADVKAKTKHFTPHTFFEIVCHVPHALSIKDVEKYAERWLQRGWSADVVSEGMPNGKSILHLRLRGYTQ